VEVCAKERAKPKSGFKFLYALKGTSMKEKIETIAKEIYGADGIN
jgi:formyltetrahydrofolate synthetase